MSKSTESTSKKNRSARIDVPWGIMLALFGLLIILNQWIGAFFTYTLTWVFGTLYVIPVLLLFVMGVRLIFIRERHFPLRASVTVGIILILLALSGFMAYLEKRNPADFAFKTIFLDQTAYLGIDFQESMSTPLSFAFHGGGIFGNAIYFGLYLGLKEAGALVALSGLAFIGLMIVFWSLLRRLAAKIKVSLTSKRKKKNFFSEAGNLENLQPINQNTEEDTTKNRSLAKDRNLQTNLARGSMQKAVFVEESASSLETERKALVLKSTVSDENMHEEIKREIITLEEPTITPPDEVMPIREEEVSVFSIPNPENKVSERVTIPVEKMNYQTDSGFSPLLGGKLPDSSLLDEHHDNLNSQENRDLADKRVTIINQTFNNLNVGASAVSYTIGPAVTRYDIKMNPDVSVSQVSKVIPDISIRLGGIPARFETIVPGKSTSGLEIANGKTSLVSFRECFEALPTELPNKLVFPFGKNIAGEVVMAPLEEFPHLLVSGSTGSGKSIFMHSLIMSLIMRNSPDELRLIVIDPKRVEMARYRDMPHLFCPIISDYAEAKTAMSRLVGEMEDRYLRFEEAGVSKISQYNDYAIGNGLPMMPKIVVVIDEYADLVEGAKDIATPIVRLAQKSRAAGIHLVISTQRPSVNVITGVIKANLPVRVALMMASTVDSTTILNEGGAEQLLGNGDMLVDCPQVSRNGFVRVQGAFIDGREIRRVVDYLKHQFKTEYDDNFFDLTDHSAMGPSFDGEGSDHDDAYLEVKKWVMSQEYTSISKIQRTFNFGFPRAMRIFRKLQSEGIVDDSSESNSARGSLVIKRNPQSIEETKIDHGDY